jgi:cytochrome P450
MDHRALTGLQESPVLVVPPKFLNELRKLPDEILNFEDAILQRAHFQYLKMAEGAKMIPFTVKSSLTPALPRLGEILTDEIERAFRTELPPCESWTPVNINRKLLRIVALVSGRVFIGEELSRTEEYLDMSINYTLELMAARRAVERMRPWLRPFLVSRLPEIRQLDSRLAQADKILQPVVSARKQLADSEKPDDMLQWLLDTQEKHKRYTTHDIARVQLVITFAAIHTTTLTATNVFYNMAAYPQYVPELREEVRTVLADHGGLYTTSALQSMKKLDSFIKESMRFDPPNAVAFSRKVRKSFTLSDGQVIPRGVIIEVPAGAVARDPTFFDHPDEFNPWRFSQLRQTAREKGEVETAAQHQFVSVNPTVLTFGYGAHACPGRFFAANEIKMILSYALNNYDIKLPEGVTERYPNVTFGTSVCFLFLPLYLRALTVA